MSDRVPLFRPAPGEPMGFVVVQWILLALLAAVLIGGPLLLWRVVDQEHKCEDAGGVRVRGTCVDRDVIIDP